MRRDWRNLIGLVGSSGTAMAALLLAASGHAQSSVSDYRLPPAPSASPAPEGPVDREHPVAAPSSTAPVAPERSAPQISLPAEPEAPRPVAVPRSATRSPQPAQSPVAAEPQAVLPTAVPTTPEIIEAPSPAATLLPESPAVPAGGGTNWWALALGAAAFAVALAALFWRRRKPVEHTYQAEEPDEPAAALPPAALPPVSRPAAPKPSPRTVAEDGPLALMLEPQSLRLSFVYATLTYRIELTNRTGGTLTALRVSADLTSGHASQPVWQQLSPLASELGERHVAAKLAPGEVLTLTGELQLPLAEVLPLRAASAAMFAPLARFHVEGRRDGGAPIVEARVFTFGQPSPRGGDTMEAIRLDLGPRLIRPVDMREIDTAPWLQRETERAAV
jgi:hypothetical protein